MPFPRRSLAAACLALTLSAPATAESFKTAFPDAYAELDPSYQVRAGAMELRQGTIKLDDSLSDITLPDGYYFMGANDAAYVLEYLWSNPSDDNILGMIFPAAPAPNDPAGWGITIEFEPIGYVSDRGADIVKYPDLLLTTAQDGISAGNQDRLNDGYGAIELVGWAAEPQYDKATNKLVWAEHLRFEGETTDTLNYEVRILGRHGVWVLSAAAKMEQLPEAKAAIPEMLKIFNFAQGHRYADFVPTDEIATIGLDGLIRGAW